MDELTRALGAIEQIRRQVAEPAVFRGYGPATLGVTAGLAVVAALMQAWLVPAATVGNQVGEYLTIWSATAVMAAGLIGWQTFNRTRRLHSGLEDAMLHRSVEQFLPALGAGMLVTFVIWRFRPELVGVMPALWMMIFALGVLASCRFLPRGILAAGVWYLLCGLAMLAAGAEVALKPWAMGVAFGVGQTMIAIVLWMSGKGEEA